MISGECRVETLPFGDSPNSPPGRKLAIDGLRLRLDLRIVPSAAGGNDAAAAAIWRIENARLATLPLGIAASYRKLAVAAGLGAMLLALGVWFAGPPSAPTTLGEPSAPPAAARALPTSSPLPGSPARTAAPREVAPSVSGAPSAGIAASGPSGSTPAVASVAASSPAPSAGAAPPALPPTAAPGVAPRIAATPASPATPSTATTAPAVAAGVEPAVRTPRGEPARPPRLASSQPIDVRAAAPAGAAGVPLSAPRTAAAAPAAAAGSRSPAPAINPPARSSARDDMLDLFGDPK